MAHPYTFGIEEELFLADARSRGVPRKPVKAFQAEAAQRFEGIERELQQVQIEICTKPSTSIREARTVLGGLRTGLADLGRAHGLKVFASGTHPIALWSDIRQTETERYRKMIDDLQVIGRRSVVCGLHVHVAVSKPDKRVDLINRLMPFMPVLLALSTSSPFWEKHRTGLSGYRLCAYAQLPRTGLPEMFLSERDYAHYVEGMTSSGAVEDATFFWWHIRASLRYPTIELRVADSCTRLEDTLSIAALYRCLVRLVERRADVHDRLTGASRGFLRENIWRAERYGTQAQLIDADAARAVPLPKMVDDLIDLIAEDAAALDCGAEVGHARTIAREGSSADGQVAVYEAALRRGASKRAALNAVVDWLAKETRGG